MIDWIIWGAIAGLAGTLILAYWEHIKSFLKRCYEYSLTLIELTKIGTKIFLKRMSGYVEEICKIYTKNKMGQWEVVTQIQKVPESEIPTDIMRRLQSQKEVDITNEIQTKIAV